MSDMMDNLTPKQQTGLVALLQHPTVRDAARAIGVQEKTLFRWLQLPEFSTAYRAARRDLVETSIASIQAATSRAVDALVRNLECGKPSVEVAAARVILDAALKGVELIELAARLDAVEQAMKQQQKATRRYV